MSRVNFSGLLKTLKPYISPNQNFFIFSQHNNIVFISPLHEEVTLNFHLTSKCKFHIAPALCKHNSSKDQQLIWRFTLHVRSHVRALLGNKCSQWKLTLEQFSWWRGHFERMVTQVRERRALGNAQLSLAKVLTVVREVENILNSLLTSKYDKAGMEMLTLSHLTFG